MRRLADAEVGGRVRFWCQDQGPGIDPEEQKRIFEPFVRVSSSPDGVGLGLSIALRVVERLDGEIGVDSQPGKGARFWLILPAV